MYLSVKIFFLLSNPLKCVENASFGAKNVSVGSLRSFNFWMYVVKIL